MKFFQTPVPDAWEDRVKTPVSDWLNRNENHPIMAKLLAYYGAPNTLALTDAQKGAVFSAIQIWNVTRKREVDSAAQMASGVANVSCVDEFEMT